MLYLSVLFGLINRCRGNKFKSAHLNIFLGKPICFLYAGIIIFLLTEIQGLVSIKIGGIPFHTSVLYGLITFIFYWLASMLGFSAKALHGRNDNKVKFPLITHLTTLLLGAPEEGDKWYGVLWDTFRATLYLPIFIALAAYGYGNALWGLPVLVMGLVKYGCGMMTFLPESQPPEASELKRLILGRFEMFEFLFGCLIGACLIMMRAYG